MEKNNGQYFDNTYIKIWRQLSQGLRGISGGMKYLVKGSFGILEGTFRVIDTTALGIGAVAILGIGGTVTAPFWAIASKDKNIIDTEKEIARLSTDPKAARVFGYPILLFVTGYSYLKLSELLK